VFLQTYSKMDFVDPSLFPNKGDHNKREQGTKRDCFFSVQHVQLLTYTNVFCLFTPQKTKKKKASNDGSDVGVPKLDLSHCVELNCPEPHARTFFFLSTCTELNKRETGVGLLPAPVFIYTHEHRLLTFIPVKSLPIFAAEQREGA